MEGNATQHWQVQNEDRDEWARNFGIRPEEMRNFEYHQESDTSRKQ